MEVQNNGHIKTSGIKNSPVREDLNTYFGLLRAMVEKIYYVDDKENNSYELYGIKTPLYTCRILGSRYDGCHIFNVIRSSDAGAVFNHSERVLTPVEEKAFKKGSGDTEFKDLNGEHVLIMCLFGDFRRGVIVGCLPHPENNESGVTKDQGKIDRVNFNGLEWLIDKSSNLRIQQRGNKSPKGQIQNTEGVGSELVLYANGDIEINAFGTNQDEIKPESNEDLRIKITKSSKKIEISSQGNKTTLDGNGIEIKDKQGDIIKLSSSGIDIKEVGGNEVLVQAGKILLKSSALIQMDCQLAKIGEGASFHAAIAENVISLYDAHQHPPIPPLVGGPVLPPLVPMSSYAGSPLDPTALRIYLKGNS